MTFDGEAYEQQLSRGLALSGERSDYFAAQRVRFVYQRALAEGAHYSRILEVGCGTGGNLVHLRAAFPEAALVGYDPEPSMLQRAQARLGPAAEVKLTDRPPSEPADLVFLNGVVHHVVSAERPAFFRTLRALTVTRGTLVIFENNPLNPGAMWVMRRIPFDREAEPVSARRVARLAADAGFVVRETRSHFYFPAALASLRALEPILERVPFGAQYAVYAEARR